LGLSRKLIYVSGLLACFSFHLDIPAEKWNEYSKARNAQPLIKHLRAVLEMTPLEILASRLALYEEKLDATKRLFGAYDEFLGLLADQRPTKSGKPPREHLDDLPIDDVETDAIYLEARAIRRKFRDALEDIFLKPVTNLYNLTMQYGVF
jgi:hypothetical protein